MVPVWHRYAFRCRYPTVVRLRVYLGHGASGTAASMAPWVDGLWTLGFDAHALELPKRRAEAAVGALLGQVPDPATCVIGGHSYGGRVASLAAARVPVAGLVCLSYPLHRPGGPELGPRVEHWPSIICPVLLLSGEADPFARLDLLRAAVTRLPRAELVTYPGLGHTLRPVLDDALGHVERFLRAVASTPAEP